MNKLLQRYLKSLAAKYQAEPELHEDISRKIYQRLASFMMTPGEYIHLEKAILSHVEETYKRLLTTKRNFCEAKKLLRESQQMSQQNVEKLLQIKTGVNNLKALLEQHKTDWGILVFKKKGQAETAKPMFEKRSKAAESTDDAPSAFPFGYGHN